MTMSCAYKFVNIKHMYENEYETNIFVAFNHYFSMKTDNKQLTIANLGEYFIYKVSMVYYVHKPNR